MTERELAANLYLIDMTAPELMSQFFLQTGKTAHQLLIASVYIHVEMEVAAIDDCMRGISAGKDISVNTHRTVIFLCRTNRNITHRSHDVMTVLQVGLDIHVTAERQAHRCLRYL